MTSTREIKTHDEWCRFLAQTPFLLDRFHINCKTAGGECVAAEKDPHGKPVR